MTYASAVQNDLYQPTLLEMAQEGNFRAIAFWINSLLEPQGIHAVVSTTRTGRLRIQLDFLRPGRREVFCNLRERVVRFICYRLWTLNSSVIDDVWIVARHISEPGILWQQSVRIASPANEPVLRTRPARVRRPSTRYRCQVLRSVLLTGLTTGGFFLGYWLFYYKVLGAGAIPASHRDESAALLTPATGGDRPQVQSLRRVLAPLGDRSQPIAQPRNPGDIVPLAFRGQVVYSVTPASQQKVVALTFDDGPWEGSTPRILDILKRYNVRSTFFVTGRQVEQFPDLTRRLVAEGHAIGNHTWNHPMTQVDASVALQEVENTTRLIQATTGVKTVLFRPPGGNLHTRMTDYAKRNNYVITLWSSDSEDYYVGAPLIVDNVLRQVRPGGIVLMHDGGGDQFATAQSLPQIIIALQRQGYRFVTVPELLEMQSTALESARVTLR